MSRPAADFDREAYPFASRERETAAGCLHYLDEGSGPALLFVHGTPTWSFDWRHLVRALAPRFRCVAPDLLGFGLSERPRDFAYTPEAHAAVIAEFVETLGLRDFTLVVHDFGGPIALPLALADDSRVARLVVINTWMWSLARDRFYASGGKVLASPFGRFLYRRLNASLRLVTPAAYADRRKLTPAIHRQLLARFPDADSRGRVLWTLARSLLGSSAYYDSLWERRARLRRLPALIVWGMKDPAFPPRLLAKWHDALPQAELVELRDSGHWPHEEEPGAVIAAVERFLAAPAPESPARAPR